MAFDVKLRCKGKGCKAVKLAPAATLRDRALAITQGYVCDSCKGEKK